MTTTVRNTAKAPSGNSSHPRMTTNAAEMRRACTVIHARIDSPADTGCIAAEVGRWYASLTVVNR